MAIRIGRRAGRLGRGVRGETTWAWIPADGGPIATVGILVDPLSNAMLVLVTLVSLLVQIYSLAYLGDERPASLGRYYTYQSLFAFSMLGLVLAPGFLQMSSSGSWWASAPTSSSATGTSGPRPPARR